MPHVSRILCVSSASRRRKLTIIYLAPGSLLESSGSPSKDGTTLHRGKDFAVALPCHHGIHPSQNGCPCLSTRASLFAPLGVTRRALPATLPYDSDRLRSITRPVFGLSSSSSRNWKKRLSVQLPVSYIKTNAKSNNLANARHARELFLEIGLVLLLVGDDLRIVDMLEALGKLFVSLLIDSFVRRELVDMVFARQE